MRTTTPSNIYLPTRISIAFGLLSCWAGTQFQWHSLSHPHHNDSCSTDHEMDIFLRAAKYIHLNSALRCQGNGHMGSAMMWIRAKLILTSSGLHSNKEVTLAFGVSWKCISSDPIFSSPLKSWVLLSLWCSEL